VALANFSNEAGLTPMSDTVWAESAGSGAPLLGTPGSASLGLIQSSALEESNVELTEELVKLIVAQRNFQANAQVIRTADETTQTIVNLR
jgi:flagellar hook protein FlgE